MYSLSKEDKSILGSLLSLKASPSQGASTEGSKLADSSLSGMDIIGSLLYEGGGSCSSSIMDPGGPGGKSGKEGSEFPGGGCGGGDE